jgi:hypothetical protein
MLVVGGVGWALKATNTFFFYIALHLHHVLVLCALGVDVIFYGVYIYKCKNKTLKTKKPSEFFYFYF